MEGDAQEDNNGRLAKELFPETPHGARGGRRKEREREDGGRGGSLGCLAVLLFFVVCVLAAVVTVRLNNGWRELTVEGE